MTTSQRAAPEFGVTVRTAERADLLSVFRIETASFDQPWPFAALESHLDATAFLVAERPGETSQSPFDAVSVLGYVVADSTASGARTYGHVKDLAVHPDHRREGIGALLLERALRRLAAQGTTAVKLEVRRSNDAARALYEAHGFEYRHTAAGYYDDGEDALVYVRDF